MAKIEIELLGDKRIIKKLNRLAERDAKKILRSAASRAMTPVSRDAKKIARSKGVPNEVAKAIGKKTKVYRNAAVTLVGIRQAEGHKRYKDHNINIHGLAGIYEKGAVPHRVGGRMHPGVPAKPYFRPALIQNKSTIKQTFEKVVLEKIEALARK